ncbi:MAG: PDZ domain-containing protein [Gemmatimonadota bacterium]|nr:MAG: PDZ domain-containing protein [Gemmatimonadota bacterium]
MVEVREARYKTPFLVLAVLFVLWGMFGAADLPNIPYAGYLTDGNNTVIQVEPSSPAEAAGLQVGDYITSIAGISVEDTRALARLQRAEVGDTRTLIVEQRAETELAARPEGLPSRSVELAYSAQPGRDLLLGIAGIFIGLCFVVFGLGAYMRAPTRSATLLALTGLCLGITFFAGPYLQSFTLRTIAAALQLVIIIFGFAFLLHFMLEFPEPKALLAKKHTTKVLYAPALLIALFALFLIILQPAGTSTLNVLIRSLFGLFVVVYFGLALWAMIHSFVKASPRQRSGYGLNFMLAGVIIGLLPVTIASLLGVLAPRVVLPGYNFYFLTLVLIPIALASAVVKTESAPVTAPVM